MKRAILIIGILVCVNCAGYAEDGLKKHVRVLSAEIGARNLLYYQNLERAARYIKNEFRSYGYEPEEQVYTMESRWTEKRPFRNIIAVKEGSGEKDKVIIVCAHYDTRRRSPGADDDASGVAAVLELARRVYKDDLKKTVKFIAFTNEDLEPVSEDVDMGSYRYAREARAKGEKIEAAVCLDMIGFYSDVQGSQHSPVPFNFFYPDTGNFIGFAADAASYRLLGDVVAEFKKASDIPAEYLVAPAPFVPEIIASDSRSFWVFGYESVWVTDTCAYRNHYYHTKDDKYDTLDYQKMSKVVDGLYGVILKLAG
ncbi:MAG: M20/M25/M40 family metallo-hydrolase [Candidatus Omnitrophica bacterium]|nr:M20/M25/M40 family metallo-hydrolase [Candidatus Omnitrophota bacterium]MDD5436372.1 M20/M25/M40 family metallo-hydrolase [Candidatus Omnitrophota bacterium]